jgi:hypothetical protein
VSLFNVALPFIPAVVWLIVLVPKMIGDLLFKTESLNLTNAITITGEAYEDIGKMYEDQPKNDWEPLGDTMHDYKGMLAGWPGILQIHSVSFEAPLHLTDGWLDELGR